MQAATRDPELTPQAREQARQHPGTWIHAVDPAFEDVEDVPGWAVVGSYRVGDDGEVSEPFAANPGYRPTPVALGFPRPTTALEAALQDAATGHGGDDAVRAALLEATVFITGGPGLAGLPVVTDGSDGSDREVVLAFTSERYLPDVGTWRYWTRVPVRELAPALGDRHLVLNPGSEVQLTLPAAGLGARSGADHAPVEPDPASLADARSAGHRP